MEGYSEAGIYIIGTTIVKKQIVLQTSFESVSFCWFFIKLDKKEDKIYYKDEDGNEYWHGKLILRNEASIEEQEDMRKLLSDICEEE